MESSCHGAAVVVALEGGHGAPGLHPARAPGEMQKFTVEEIRRAFGLSQQNRSEPG